MFKPELHQATTTASASVTLSFVPAYAHAADGRTIGELLTVIFGTSAFVLLVWVAYYTLLHQHFIQRNNQYKRVVLPLLGAVALVLGLISIITGEFSFYRGRSVLRALEPNLFWQCVGLEIGAGFILILIGYLYRPSRS